MSTPTDEEWERIEWERDLWAELPEWNLADHGWRCFCLDCQEQRDEEDGDRDG